MSTDGDIRFDIIDDDGSECKGQKLLQTKPINMTKQFSGGEVICARRGGQSLLESVRVNPRLQECPDGLLPCITDEASSAD